MVGSDDTSPLVDAVLGYFLSRGWPITRHESLPIVRMEFAADNAEGTMFVQVFDDRRRVVTYAELPVVVPEKRRMAMAELLIRANSALAIGNFDLNFDDGKVRFRTGIDLGTTELTDELLDPLIQACLVTVGDHAGALSAVIEGTPAQEAIDAVWDDAASVDIDFR